MNRTPSGSSVSPDNSWLYQEIIELAPTSLAIIDAQEPKLLIVYVNAAFEALTGYSSGDIIGRDVEFLLGDHQDQGELELIRAGLREQTACVGTVRSTRKDGSLYWNELRLSPRRDAAGQVTHFIAVQNDITTYKQTEETLRQSQERLKATVEIMPDLIFYHGADTTILGYHAPSETMLALRPEQFLGKTIAEVFPPEQAELFSTAVMEAIKTRQLGRLEYSIETLAGIREFEARYIPSGVDEIMAIVRDVTALRQVERQAMNLALEQERTHLLTEFIRNASHEFRTPLSLISSSAYLMARSDDPEKRQFRAEQIEASVLRTTKLVDLLLKMVTLDTNLPDRTSIDIASLLHYLRTEILSPDAAARIQFEIPPELPPIVGYSEHLIDALRQLLDNALRYTPAEGRITVRAYTRATDMVIEVEDTGAGIAADSLPHIFETFWRQDEAHSTPGLGLGLSIAQKIVDLHGGRIEVESEVGQGSTFRVLLPR